MPLPFERKLFITAADDLTSGARAAIPGYNMSVIRDAFVLIRPAPDSSAGNE